MKLIYLTQGKVTVVDDEDYERLYQRKWHARKYKHTFYVGRSLRFRKPDGTRGVETVHMHHEIIGKPAPGLVTDHINGDGLDNRRENLRHVTHRQNRQNLHIKKSSIFPGVCWNKDANKWQTRIAIDGKTKYLGLFTNELEAAQAYIDACKALDG